MSTFGNLSLTLDFRAGGLPILVTPNEALDDNNPSLWQKYESDIKDLVREYLPKHGGILFRGFQKEGIDTSIQSFAQMFGHELLSYEFGSTPRTDLGKGVYTATEYPASQIIPLHNEQAYTLSWPMNIWFHCVTEPTTHGETPIADSRKIYQKMPKAIRERFEQKRLMYVRNYGNGLDLPWETVFNTESEAQVETFCRANHIDFEWKDDGELRTRQICQATAQHPVLGDWVWFNQAHLFHISNLEESTKEVLLDVVEIEDLPRNVYYGDGSPIEDSILDEVRAVLAEETVLFPWQEGDFMMLDNMLAAHGRSTFTGPRKIVVAMADGFDSISASSVK